MRRRPVAVLPLPEYPRPVLPAGLDEDQQDMLLDELMTQLMTGRPCLRREAPLAVEVPDVEVREVIGGDWDLGDDVIEL